MRKFVLASAAILALAAPATAEVRAHSGFDGVAASGHFDVEVSIGAEFLVDITGPDAARLRTHVEDDTLKIQTRNRPWFGGEPHVNATVHVTLPRLESLVAARGAEVSAVGLDSDDLDLVAAMGGELTASGACGALSATAAMGGVINAGDLHCVSADVSAAMGGDARVFATESLDASAAMGGSVRVGGAPAHTDISTAMGGDVDLR